MDGPPRVSFDDDHHYRAAPYRRLPQLAQGRHIGHVCNIIEGHGLAGKGWTATQIWHQLDLFTRTLNKDVPAPSEWHNPVGYFRWLLKNAIPFGAFSPSHQLAIERRDRDAARRARAAAEAEMIARIHAQKNEIDAIIASMPRPIAPRRRIR